VSATVGTVREWMHSRKGPVRGVVVWDTDEWLHIRLDGDQSIRYYGAAGRIDGPTLDGEVLVCRKSFMTEVQS
jgi:hypothetical protein